MSEINKDRSYEKKELYRLDDVLIYRDDDKGTSYSWVKWLFVGEKGNQVLYRVEGEVCIHPTSHGDVVTICLPKSYAKDDIKISEVKSYYTTSKQWLIKDVEWFIKLLDYGFPLGVFNFRNCEESSPEESAEILSDLGYETN